MNELMLKMDLEGMQRIASNLDDIKLGLEEMVAVFKEYRVTPENYAESKKTLADLRKAETALEDERKRLKKAWQKPYEEWEKQYKIAIAPLQETIAKMADGVRVITEEDDNKRLIGRRGFIDSLLKPLNLNSRVHIEVDQIWNDSWKNKSVSDKAFTDECTARIQQVMKDLAFLSGKDRAVILKYSETLDLTAALEYEKSLSEPAAEAASDNAGPSFEFSFKEGIPQGSDNETVVMTRSFRAERWKLSIMFQIAKQLGIKMKIEK